MKFEAGLLEDSHHLTSGLLKSLRVAQASPLPSWQIFWAVRSVSGRDTTR
jgi:hypothetical protein